ncbi:histidine kinase dimerization/phospho-acceptor domain-containing protein [Cerasicoccus frondis]|uniref:histidine kinase dimerization/phospho-acceptor domain-containing protein n=1 Tax=Cerasicoccus frondis TaxID=490090 RepID=UPI0028528939|nr:histidine kinase dimerization/phospho-acceptor domain-containing protein [Cerasicoccus frondis]
MKFRPILLAWLLLLGATLIMGAGAWWLLDREADRVDALASVSLANGAASVAESVDLLMEEIRSGVSDGLLVARQSPMPRNALSEFVSNNPYVAVGFYFRDDDGVTTWYGARGNAPSPTALRESADGAYPWSLAEAMQDDMEEQALVMNTLLKGAYDNEFTPKVNRRPLIQAPTDFIEDNRLELKDQSEKQETEPPQQKGELEKSYSKSAALRRQRENVRQVNVASNIALNQQAAEPPADYSYAPEADYAVPQQELFADNLSSPTATQSYAPPSAKPSTAPSREAQSAGQEREARNIADLRAVAESKAEAAKKADAPPPPAESPTAFAFAEPVAVVQQPDRNGFLPQQDRWDADSQFGRDYSRDEADFASQSETGFALDGLLGDEFAVGSSRVLPGIDDQPKIEPWSAEDLFFRLNDAPRLQARSGWLVNEFDDAEQWLAWVDLPGQGNILGAWLNRETVLAEMAKTISISQQKDVQFALVDAEGRRVAGAGGDRYSSVSRAEPALTLNVGAALPGWKIEAYPALAGNPFGSSFRLLGGLTVTGLSIAILLGGSLLLWQSQRDALDAQRKTTFVANVSHELKTPLTSIRLFAEMLYDGRAGDERKRQRYLQTMLNETQRLTRLVNNVLDFSRLERGRRDFQHEEADVASVVGDIIEMQRDRLHGEGLAVEFSPPNEPICAQLDRDALEQILLNLLDNAAKYALSGERVVVSLQSEGEGWSLSVCDFGPGIPAWERQQVFEAFHRIDDRLTAERPGCGLGLSIAARLAQGLGGQLRLEPNDPQGCCFKLIVTEKVSAHGKR